MFRVRGGVEHEIALRADGVFVPRVCVCVCRYVMGATHAEWGPFGKLQKEFTLVDEVAIWKQIHLHTADAAAAAAADAAAAAGPSTPKL